MNESIWIRWIVRVHKPVLITAALATVASTVLLYTRGLREDYRLEAFVASDDGAYQQLRAFMQEFTSNEFALIAIHLPRPYEADDANLLTSMQSRLRKLDAVQMCSSVADIPAAARLLLGKRLLSHPLIEGNLISADRRTLAILMRMSGESAGGRARRETVRSLRRITREFRRAHPDLNILLAGPYVTLIDMYEYVDRDLRVFSMLAFALTVISLWAVFRRFRPMIFASATAAATILCTLGVTVQLGVVTSLITQMIVILVIVLTVANCVHLAVASEETTESGVVASLEGARVTLRRMLAPCTAVLITTAAGFGSVCISQIAPVRRFGALMVLGLMMALIISLCGSVWLHGAHRPWQRGRSWLDRLLDRGAGLTVSHGRLIGIVVVAVTAIIAMGTARLRFESDFVKNFRAGTGVRRSYRFIESHLSPLGSVEVVARTESAGGAATADAVQAASTLSDRFVEKFPMVRKAISVADVLTLVSPTAPATDAQVRSILAVFSAMGEGKSLLRNFVNQDRSAQRINLRCVEGYDVDQKLAACARMERQAANVFGDGYDVEVTGLYYFYAKLMSGLLRDQYRAFALTVPAIFVVLWLVFRSLRVAAVAMLANLIPVIVCLGAMGWARIPVNMTTAMMLSVVLGIAVDDTLHYVWRYRRELARCGSPTTAIHCTHQSVGRACFFTSVVITGGFSILVLSQFLPTAYFGGLVGFTMVAALVVDLLLLPVLLRRICRGVTRDGHTDMADSSR